ncbi:MAG: hypothetical protein LBQ67_03400, partial [Treponema sp.]|jgi:hypothetical protein|nr:hypothetical protein [Treponema sp.]
MKKVWDYAGCVTVMGQEIGLLKKIASVQESVRKAVLAREWADFDGKIAEVNLLGEEFALLDAERDALFSALAESLGLKKTEAPAFYTLAAHLSEAEQRELCGLYRAVKMETLKIQVFNETFLNYLRESTAMAAACLEALFPARSGKLYTRKGGQVKGDLKSMVLNRHI